jgi:hypothetical protein
MTNFCNKHHFAHLSNVNGTTHVDGRGGSGTRPCPRLTRPHELLTRPHELLL